MSPMIVSAAIAAVGAAVIYVGHRIGDFDGGLIIGVGALIAGFGAYSVFL